MKLSLAFGVLASVAWASAEDLLFLQGRQGDEYNNAVAAGYSTKVVTDAEWRTLTTADFASYKAIVVGDQYCDTNKANLQVLTDTRSIWGPAVLGKIIIIGTDPSLHASSVAGAAKLTRTGVQFAMSGTAIGSSTPLTGLYFALSCYYAGYANDGPDTVASLSYFGEFGVAPVGNCFDNAHIVAASAGLGDLDDAALSRWGCSVHTAFTSYPATGLLGFSALAIARDVIASGSQTFSDGSVGLPYILSRGASPLGCGDGTFSVTFGEECDDGNVIDGDGCSSSCKCESGVVNGDGTCGPAPPVCGNAQWEPTGEEECDDGNTVSGDGCSSTCKCEAPLVPSGAGSCTNPPPRCGDEKLDAGEECDSASDPDCSSDCKCVSPKVPDSANPGSCTNPPPRCGDGKLDAGEECDSASDPDCSSDCKCVSPKVPDSANPGSCTNPPPRCGDGKLDAGEECDSASNPDCSSDCKCVSPKVPDSANPGSCTNPPPRCGDGQVDSGEECDGSENCSAECKCKSPKISDKKGGCIDPLPICGDGKVNALGEECDGGAGCSSSCLCNSPLVSDGFGGCKAAPAKCGDGKVNVAGEECDDGNNVDGDGCSSLCKCELPLVPDGKGGCQNPPARCGDGVRNAEIGEECDDGNLVNGDGCSKTCKCERPLIPDGHGYCVQAPPKCGNSKWEAINGEECDKSYGCGKDCKCVSPLVPLGNGKCGPRPSKCGDGIWNPKRGEHCDSGNTKKTVKGCLPSCKCAWGYWPDGRGRCVKLINPRPPYKSCYPTYKAYGAAKTPIYARSAPSQTPDAGDKPSQTYVAASYITPAPYTGPRIVGIEVIEHVDISEVDGEQVTSTRSTLNRPIWNTHFDTMPDYVAALSTEGIPFTPAPDQFLTVSTKACDKCESTPTWLPTVRTASNAVPVTLTGAAPWATTPSPQDDTAVLQPAKVPHDHKKMIQDANNKHLGS